MVYNFWQELELYCKQDVLILKKAVEAYFESFLVDLDMDVWSCMSSASVAQTVFRQNFMNENTFAVESEEICELIRPALHGGRVDVRRMLKEWSPEEMAAGVHGRYLDVQSMYPYVQVSRPMPTGPGKLVKYKLG